MAVFVMISKMAKKPLFSKKPKIPNEEGQKCMTIPKKNKKKVAKVMPLPPNRHWPAHPGDGRQKFWNTGGFWSFVS
jgi:hypothetical protein